jgi:hypothetical protein
VNEQRNPSAKAPPRAAIARTPIVPERVRRIDGSFAFLPHRFLREGFFVSLTPDELRLYALFVLAADRNGISFYHYDSICSLLEIPIEVYVGARNALIRKDLIAFDGTRFQVLSLPERPLYDPAPPLCTAEDFEQHDPATIHRTIANALPAASTRKRIEP